MSAYGGKPIASLTDHQLALAEDDVANCLLRAYEAPASAAVQVSENGLVTDSGRYGKYFESLSDLAAAIQAEKEGRANAAN